jgi:hypothetical protein
MMGSGININVPLVFCVDITVEIWLLMTENE